VTSAKGPYELSRSNDVQSAVEEWTRTADSSVQSVDVSATPLGLRPWATHFADESLSLFQLRRRGVLTTIWPVASRARRLLGVTLRLWSSPGNFYWQFGYPIGGEDLESAIAAALEHLRQRRDWDVLDVGPILSSSPHAAALRSGGERLGMNPEVCGRKHDPIVVVRETWDDYCARLSGNLKEKIRYGERRLAREGQLSFVEYGGGPDLDERLREFYALEASGWKGREGTAIASDPTVQAFYTDLAGEAAGQGRFRLYGLRVGDRLVASDYCIVYGDVVHLLKIAYDEGRARCSPGQVIRKLVLQRLFEQRDGLIYDLMTGGGDHADYKLRWANAGREYIVLRLFNPATARGYLSRAGAGARRTLSRLRSRAAQP
jgi:Acetyltransferase (GNAT) domain